MKRTIHYWTYCQPALIAHAKDKDFSLIAFEDAKSDILELYCEMCRLKRGRGYILEEFDRWVNISDVEFPLPKTREEFLRVVQELINRGDAE